MRDSVLCLGLAQTGEAVATVLAREGAVVTVVEEHPGGDLYSARANVVRAVGARVVEAPTDNELDALVDATDLVVPSPGVRPSHRAIRRALDGGIAVRSELDLAAERVPAVVPLIAVTGTNGKTTTTDLTTRMLERGGSRVVCGGNIGTPLLALVEEMPGADAVVAEVSSFQLEFTTAAFRPHVAVLLNVAPDHLEWHQSFAAYVRAKARVFAHQRDDDLLVVNADDVEAHALAAHAPARVVSVTIAGRRPGSWSADQRALYDPTATEMASLTAMRRSLPHDRTNALCAAAAASELGASLESVVDVLRAYQPMPHRVQLVGERAGVRWYDDSKATNPHAVMRAVAAFESVVLLAGGLNKDLDLDALRDTADRVRAVVAFGAAADEVEAAFAGLRPVRRASTMREVVHTAASLAEAGDAVLLSPGCASFDMYPGGYTERGDDFAREVASLFASGHARTCARDQPVETTPEEG